MMIWFVSNVALATEILGGDLGGGDLVVADGDVLEGTFTNVGRFVVPVDAIVYVQAGFPLIIEANEILIDGTLDGVGAGLPGGAGGEYAAGFTNPGDDGSGQGFGTGGLQGPCVHGGGGGGGGHGGNGGDGGYYFAGNTGFGGTRYGSDYDPTLVQMGSGGGGGGASCSGDGGRGGAGGAAITLNAGIVTINGTVDASGQKGITSSDNYTGGGGGGSGGTVQIDAGIIAGAGIVGAAGGNGGDNGPAASLESGGGGGGGGRVRIYWGQIPEPALQIFVGGGAKGADQSAFNALDSQPGEPGTEWIENVDPDADDDGVLKAYDNCPETPNPDQTDTDTDGIGDACDACPIDPIDSDQDSVCDSVDQCPGGDDLMDADGDLQPDDCDCAPDDPRAQTNGIELCDGFDNNCDDLVDPIGSEGEGTYFLDLDGDGYGRYQDFQFACEAPLNYVPVGGDCDDDRIAVNPAEPEFCDDVDNDCDGLVDQQCAQLPQTSTSSCGGCDSGSSPGGAGLLAAAALALSIRRRRE